MGITMEQITKETEDKFIDGTITSLRNQIEVQVWILINRHGWAEESVLQYISICQAIYKWHSPFDVTSVGMLHDTLKELKELVSCYKKDEEASN
jgi:hypothetical protein